MPSFSRFGVFYCVSLVTGPFSALLRVKFCPDHEGPPIVDILTPDIGQGNPSDDEVASSVVDAVRRANIEFGAALIPGKIAYQCDNHGSYLIRRCAYIIVRRIVEYGDDGFADAK